MTSEDKVEETAAVNKTIEMGTKEKVKVNTAQDQLPHARTEVSLVLSFVRLAIADVVATRVLKKKIKIKR